MYSLNKDYDTMTYEFTNPPLPFAYNALEPYIDSKTMTLHHNRHLKTYIDKLNAALKPYPAYQNWSLVKLLSNLSLFPQPLRLQIQNNAGGVYNHFFYFDSLTNNQTVPQEITIHYINIGFGSTDAFTKAFKEAALSVFGSGYAWLVLNKRNKASIITTANQDCPISDGLYPLLTVDVWEHAYYLLHYNDRSAYLDNFFKVINWNTVESRLNTIL